MNLILKIFTVAFVLLSSNLTFAQEHETSLNESHDTQEGPKHIISVELGHNHLSDGFVDGEKHWLTVPSWSVNYIYMFNHKFGIGLQTDMIVESFKVVSKDSKNNLDIERTFPVSFVGIAGYKPVHFLFLFIGGACNMPPKKRSPCYGLVWNLALK